MEIERAKEQHWKEFVNNADGKSIWEIKKYIDNTPMQTFIPMLEGNATTIEQKSDALRKAFFPEPPEADLTDINNDYPPQVQEPSPVSLR